MKKKLSDPIILGNLSLPSRVFYSPLAGCSDYPFRKMAARFFPGLIYCEMVKMDALLRNDSNTMHLLDFSHDMHPIGGQLVGGKVEYAGRAAKIIEDLGFDVIDLNCGCPVDKVTKDGSGSGLLKEPGRIGDILAEMVAAVDIPVTVKIRAGWDESSIEVKRITEIAEAAGAKAIAIHGRTRKQAYRGPANWDYIKIAKDAAKDILVIGNGDVFSPQAARDMVCQTGCDIVLVSRGTMGAPWMAEDIYAFEDSNVDEESSYARYVSGLKEHYQVARSYHSPRKVIVDMRRISCWYMKKDSKMKEFRKQMSRASSLEEVESLLNSLDG